MAEISSSDEEPQSPEDEQVPGFGKPQRPSGSDKGTLDENNEPTTTGKENLQGPHRWRERLRPVARNDGRRLTGIRDPRVPENNTSNTVERSDSFDRPWRDGRRFNKEDRMNDQKIRERLRAMPVKKDSFSRKQSGPMVVKPVTGAQENLALSQAPVSYIPLPSSRRRHKTPHGESAFTRNVVNNPTSGLRRRLSPHNSFQNRQSGSSAGFYSGRRTPSPNTLYDLAAQTELTNKRIVKVRRARLYLLQQMGPNTFMIGGDSPDHKFKVIIGPQTCSCGRGPHCVHLLFVMLRVFQVNEADPCLWARTLKNFEVEALFRVYHNRRSCRLAARHEMKKARERERRGSTCSEEPTIPAAEGDAGSGKDEEDTCPICLLEMLEGESLIKCEGGCQNRLHHHCISIWFEECRRQSEALNCPLCRAQWKSDPQENSQHTSEHLESVAPPIAPPNTRASSPTREPQEENRLPQADPIPPDHRDTAEPWIAVLGDQLVPCFFSRNWSIRETGLRHLSLRYVSLHREMGDGQSEVMLTSDCQAATQQLLDTCCQILTYMSADPVYKVFVASLRTLRTMLSYTPCRGSEQRRHLQALIKPIVHSILLKCTEGNRRTSQLSISTIVELAKGQSGELAVGREIINPGLHGLGGIQYVIECVTEPYCPDTVQWQWLLGRMYILERLLEEFSDQFFFYSADNPGSSTLDGSTSYAIGQPSGYHLIISVSHFLIKAIGYSHSQVAKLARRLFLVATYFVAHDPTATRELESMLENTEASLAPALRRKFNKIISDNNAQTLEEVNTPCELNNSVISSIPVQSPSISPASTPRCNSPESMKYQSYNLEDGQSEASSSATTAPIAPPNTPRHPRRTRPEPEGCSDVGGSLDASDQSENLDEVQQGVSMDQADNDSISGSQTHLEEGPPLDNPNRAIVPDNSDVFVSDIFDEANIASGTLFQQGEDCQSASSPLLYTDKEIVMETEMVPLTVDVLIPNTAKDSQNNTGSQILIAANIEPATVIDTPMTTDTIPQTATLVVISPDNMVSTGSENNNEESVENSQTETHISAGILPADSIQIIPPSSSDINSVVESVNCNHQPGKDDLELVSNAVVNDDPIHDQKPISSVEVECKPSLTTSPETHSKSLTSFKSETITEPESSTQISSTEPAQSNTSTDSSLESRSCSETIVPENSTDTLSLPDTANDINKHLSFDSCTGSATDNYLTQNGNHNGQNIIDNQLSNAQETNDSIDMNTEYNAITETPNPCNRHDDFLVELNSTAEFIPSQSDFESQDLSSISEVSELTLTPDTSLSEVVSDVVIIDSNNVHTFVFEEAVILSNNPPMSDSYTEEDPPEILLPLDTNVMGDSLLTEASSTETLIPTKPNCDIIPEESPSGSENALSLTHSTNLTDSTLVSTSAQCVQAEGLRDSWSTGSSSSNEKTLVGDTCSHRTDPPCGCESQHEAVTVKVRRSVSDVSSTRIGGVGTNRKPYQRSKYSRSVMLTEDLDLYSHSLSEPFSPDKPVSFKSEVATPSPEHSPSTTAGQESADYKCKEEVELEEALALAKALEASSRQDPIPIVPGLTPSEREEVITIRIQPEGIESDDQQMYDQPSPGTSRQQPKLYLENIHWVKGILLGTGAYSSCYQARDVKTGAVMAVKQMSFCRNSRSEQEKVVETISEEIHMMARLNHPNVLRLLGATKQGCHFNMFVEWMAGGSVAFLLDQYGAFSEQVLINYVQQILRGLAYLHDHHILHRDLKGANLLIDSSGQRLRIADFGASARLASRSTGAEEFKNQLIGTVAFMAPEVLRGENYGRSCDVWSIGCVMIEMLTSKPPWSGHDVTNHYKLLFKIASTDQPPPLPANVSPPVKDVMLRCLEMKQQNRPTAKDLLLHPLFTRYKVPGL